MDRFSKEIRSRIMASVPSKGNRSTEQLLGSMLWQSGLRGYRKQWPVAGHPDFAWPGIKLAVFVDGCFWHGCRRCRNLPQSNASFWREKIDGNQRRDKQVTVSLRRAGWTVLRVKECELRLPSTLRRIAVALHALRRDEGTPPEGLGSGFPGR